MRIKHFFILLLAMVFAVQGSGENSNTQLIQHNESVKSYSFVVIGAFVFQMNAKKYAAYMKKKNVEVKYAINPFRNLYYVYTYYSEVKEEAVTEVYKVREKYKIPDAWVYTGPLAGLEGVKIQPELNYTEIVKTEENKPEYTYIPQDPDEEVINATKELVVADTSGNIDELIKEEPAIVVTQVEDTPTEERPFGKIQPADIPEPVINEDFKVYVNAINSKQLTEVTGPVEIFDEVRNRRIKDVESQTLFGLNDPKNGDGTVRLISRIFGYRPKEAILNLLDPVAADSLGLTYTVGDSIVIDLPLERLQKGDIAVMWNVLFYKDAAIMRPESKAELNSLLQMLQENDNMKIALHGHTNGNSRGSIIHIGDNDFNYFSLNGDHVTDRGTAKQLSEYRAATIQMWLSSNGIDKSRMSVNGWGGDKMLHDKTDPKAYENVRVEVEIVEN